VEKIVEVPVIVEKEVTVKPTWKNIWDLILAKINKE
jgi:hypothetical protein